MKDEIVNGLLQKVPGVEMTAFTLGTVPLRVVGIKGVQTSFDAMHLDLEIRWSSDLYARLEVRAEWKRTCCVFDYVPDAFWYAILLYPHIVMRLHVCPNLWFTTPYVGRCQRHSTPNRTGRPSVFGDAARTTGSLDTGLKSIRGCSAHLSHKATRPFCLQCWRRRRE